MKYIDWLIQWQENYIRPSVKVRTYERYRLIIEQHIKDKIGSMELNDLSPLVLQRFITELLLSGNKKTGKGFHSLRHTFATRALECGMDVKTLSEILGHKNPTVTLNRYVHALMEHKADMMNRIGKLL